MYKSIFAIDLVGCKILDWQRIKMINLSVQPSFGFGCFMNGDGGKGSAQPINADIFLIWVGLLTARRTNDGLICRDHENLGPMNAPRLAYYCFHDETMKNFCP